MLIGIVLWPLGLWCFEDAAFRICLSNCSFEVTGRRLLIQREGGREPRLVFFDMAGPCTTTEHSCWGMPQTATELAIPGPKTCESKGGLLFACNVRPESEGGFRTKQGGNKTCRVPARKLVLPVPVRKTEEKGLDGTHPARTLSPARLHSGGAAVFGRPCPWGGGHSKGASWQQWGLKFRFTRLRHGFGNMVLSSPRCESA